MTILFIILILIAAVVLSFLVLVQNPKGGGLASNVGGFSNQYMGVKQTTDVLEKGTWIFASVIAILCITSTVFLSSGDNKGKGIELGTPPPAQTTAPAQQGPTLPAPITPAGTTPAAPPTNR